MSEPVADYRCAACFRYHAELPIYVSEHLCDDCGGLMLRIWTPTPAIWHTDGAVGQIGSVG
jgi:hypothetical protein